MKIKAPGPFLKKIIRDIEYSHPQVIKRRAEGKTAVLWNDPSLLSNLSGWIGALLVRSVLHQLKIDEYHVFSWRLENKYIQYLVFNHYLPGDVPETFGLTELLSRTKGVQQIEKLIDQGFFVKATLGDGSGRTKSFDRTADLDDIIHDHFPRHFLDEDWILQKKLDLVQEFRIHSFSKEIIYGLTFNTQGTGLANHDGAEEFLRTVLEKLPDTILQGTLIGWDIGLNSNGKYDIIEANFTGFHPIYRRGFQTTGFVDDNTFGPIVSAWINNYFRAGFGVSIAAVDHNLLSAFPYLKAFLFYSGLLKNISIDLLCNPTKKDLSAILYLEEYTDQHLITLIHFFQKVGFAAKYYVISNEKSYKVVAALFVMYPSVHVVAEHTLFTKERYQLIRKLNYGGRKMACCTSFVRLMQEQSYVII